MEIKFSIIYAVVVVLLFFFIGFPRSQRDVHSRVDLGVLRIGVYQLLVFIDLLDVLNGACNSAFWPFYSFLLLFLLLGGRFYNERDPMAYGFTTVFTLVEAISI